MRKHILILLFLSITGLNVLANSDKYKINDSQLDQLFENSTEMSIPSLELTDGINSFPSSDFTATDKAPWVAFTLSMVYYFTGISGIHRVYLGAGAGVFIAYFCTGGGFGILQIIDSIVLFLAAMEDDISPYIDNRKLFMW